MPFCLSPGNCPQINHLRTPNFKSSMEICLIPDSLTLTASIPSELTFGFSKPFNPSPENFHISAAVATPRTRVKAWPQKLLKQRRRTKKRSSTAGGGEDGSGEELFGFYGGDDGGDGPFNGGGGGGAYGGGNWNFGWDEFFSDNNESNGGYHDPAFDFVYEVLSWIVLSNCLHFAVQKFARIARPKVPMRLGSVC